jgi:hypothetical protein
MSAGGQLNLTNTLISDNSAALLGGGLAVGVGTSTCGLAVVNSTIIGNFAAHGGAQVFMDGAGDASFTSTDVQLGTSGSQASP